MLSQQQSVARIRWTMMLVPALLLASATTTLAQEVDNGLSLGAISKRVAIDPTTYAPAIIAYKATRMDWDTSQPFFNRGANEMNARFTISGLSNDVPISYEAGNRKILADALVNVGTSAAYNFASRLTESLLEQKYPQHRKLIHGLGWAERISLGSLLAYKLSHQHFEQAQLNQYWSQQLGFTR